MNWLQAGLRLSRADGQRRDTASSTTGTELFGKVIGYVIDPPPQLTVTSVREKEIKDENNSLTPFIFFYLSYKLSY